MATPYNLVSRDAALALTEFSDEFREALVLASDFPLWAEQFGLVRNTDALKTIFPIPISAAGYKLLENDITFRSLYARSLSMKSREWFDGVEERADILEAPDFQDWAGEPARMALEWQRQPNILAAEVLATSSFNGPLLDFYRDPDTEAPSTRRLFASDHPFNVLDSSVGTFENFTTTTVAEIQNGVFWSEARAYFRSLKGPNGKSLGLRLADILVPGTREELFDEALKQDTLIRAVSNAGAAPATSNVVAAVTQSNRFKGTIGLTVADELDNAVNGDDYFYCLAQRGPAPWVIQRGSSPEEIIHDKQSELYKRSRRVGFASVGKMNVAAAMPHRILRVQITG